MKLTASAKSGIQGTSFLLIAIGVIMLFGEIHYVGEALESTKINLLFNGVSVAGGGLILLPVIVLLILFFRKNHYQ